MYEEIRLPEDWTPASLHEALGDGVHVGPASWARITFLDTFDWRIATKTARLWLERSSHRRELRWTESRGAPPYTLPVEGETRWTRDLPEGHLRSRLDRIVGVRALITVGSCRLQRYNVGIRDAGDNNTLHVCVERVRLSGPSGAPTGAPIWLAKLRGVPEFEDVFEHAVATLTAVGASGDGAADLLGLAVEASGRSVGDYSSKLRISLNPQQPSDEALRSILRTLLETLAANVDGTIADLDTEFLHDLRVAARRTRSALTQIRSVLGDDQVAPYLEDFKWLGAVTGPCRDLDVFQMEMDSYRRALPDIEQEIEPLYRVIGVARREAHEEVCTALESDRFKALLTSWHSFLADPAPPGERAKNADRPVLELASARILKAYRRMVKRGRTLGSEPPPEVLHRLRIDAKKLRYLLEFFRSLYPGKKIDRLVKELKRLQDILGGYNDVEVQQRRLKRFGHSLSSSRRDHTETLMAMGRLTTVLEDRQRDFRESFAQAIATFTDPRSRSRYRSLFGPGT